MELSTSNLLLDHQTIIVEIQPEAVELARWVIVYFESEMRNGVSFRDGQTIELGWVWLKLHQVNDVLEVFEPDFSSFPIRWRRGVNNTVKHLGLQRAMCDLFDCDPLFSTVMQAGVVSPNFAESQDCVMFRDVPAKSDSGWALSEVGYEGSEGKFCSLYQLALQKNEIVPFLALPASSRVVIGSSFREVTLGSVTKSSENCKLLQSLLTLKLSA